MSQVRREFLTIYATVMVACGGTHDTVVLGGEGSDCYPNRTCNDGLTCLSNLCVRVVVDSGAPMVEAGTTIDATGVDSAIRSDAAEAGTVDDSPPFTPAAHPMLPQVATLGGQVLVTPKVQPIVYAGDSAAADIEAFLKELTLGSYWSDTTAEYGVGKLTVLPTITLATAAPAVRTDNDLKVELTTNTSGPNPIWGTADPNVIYLFVVPDGSTVKDATSSCCSDFGGYHGETKVGGVAIPYAVGCSCPGFLGFTFTGLQVRTAAISHELIETATDPFPFSNPAYQLEDRADIVWTVVTGGEVGDMCAFNDDAYYVPPGSKYMVARTWSNAAAKAMQNPCVPHATTAPYFNSFPALESISLGDANYLTRGVNVPLGQTKTIELTLYSGAATKNTWAVSAVDYDYWVRGLPSSLDLSLDKSEGKNGDTLHLTITPKRADPDLHAEAFIIISHYGGVRDADYQTNLTMSLVTN
jgi:hypothetical protein